MRTYNIKIDILKKYNLAHLMSAFDTFKWDIEMEVVKLVLINV